MTTKESLETFIENTPLSNSKDEKPIFVIIMVDANNKKIIDINRVGFYYNLDIAIEAVQDNTLDINSAGTYNYALIAATYQGIYKPNYKETRLCFKYNKIIEKYELIEEPKFFIYTTF